MRSKSDCARHNAPALANVDRLPTLEDVGALCRAYLASLRLPAQATAWPGCRVVRLDRALIHHCVADARAKGAEELIRTPEFRIR